jgi:hypothetical protein
MKYAFALDMPGEGPSWALAPWQQRGLEYFDCVANVPDTHVLIANHFAPWWSPLKEYIAEGRPWIEIEYGYWGPDTPRRETRRVTYCGHHNMNIRPAPYSRADLFLDPLHRPWRNTIGEYVIGIQPVEEILLQRTGENLHQFRDRLTRAIQPYWSGPIHWRKKRGGAKLGRFDSYVEQLQNAHAVIGERTMATVEACLLGVPGYTVDASMSSLLVGGIENLGNLQQPNRTDWWEHICWSQFNREEFNTSIPADLVERYQILTH